MCTPSVHNLCSTDGLARDLVLNLTVRMPPANKCSLASLLNLNQPSPSVWLLLEIWGRAPHARYHHRGHRICFTKAALAPSRFMKHRDEQVREIFNLHVPGFSCLSPGL